MEEITPSLLLLDLPPAALAGVDLLSFTTAPAFRGIKGIPSGPHFFFTAPHSTLAVRHGTWFWIGQADLAVTTPEVEIGNRGNGQSSELSPQLVIKKWDAMTETLRDERDAAARMRHRANLGQIWRSGMTPYRQRAGDNSVTGGTTRIPAETTSVAALTDSKTDTTGWSALSNYVSRSYLRRVLGPDEDGWHLTSYSDTASGANVLPDLDLAKDALKDFQVEKPLGLMHIDLKRTWPDGATGRERTDKARDRSWYLFDLAARYSSESDDDTDGERLKVILAELQFVFLMALTLNNYACLEHWRTLLRLVFTCRAAVATAPEFFSSFLSVLRGQVSRLGAEDAAPLEAPEPAAQSAGTATGPERNVGSLAREKAMEEQTEEELLRYDLPVRSKGGTRASKNKALAAEAQAMAREAETERAAARQAVEGDELRQLFLEEDSDGAGKSFLRGLLVKFRLGLEEDNLGKGATGHIKETIKALSALEAALFDLFGWDFDTLPAAPKTPQPSLKDARPFMAADDVDLDGYGVPTIASGGLRDRNLHVDDDVDVDEDDDYAPAVVELSQAEMDALGFQGTPSGPSASFDEVGAAKAAAPVKQKGFGGGISGVVVEDSSDDEQDGSHEAESDDDLNDTVDLEDMDTRY